MIDREEIDDLLSRLIRSSAELVDAVSFDDNGEIIGGKITGGNGGLISHKTITKADEVRRVLAGLALITVRAELEGLP